MSSQISLSVGALKHIIQQYTRESGVRNLNRRIGGVMRNAAKQIAMDGVKKVNVKVESLRKVLGPSPFNRGAYSVAKVSGVAVGLAWTSVGGDILFIEASLSPGTGKLTLTGNLGDVMKESATTALSFIKANSKSLHIDPEVFSKHDIHIHVPEGAIPKDGPSAGVTMLTALASVLTGKKVKPYLAMTGEITLRGKVLPVGGIKEKVLAAKRSGIKTILLSDENEKQVEEINQSYIKDVNFVYTDDMQEVLQHALK